MAARPFIQLELIWLEAACHDPHRTRWINRRSCLSRLGHRTVTGCAYDGGLDGLTVLLDRLPKDRPRRCLELPWPRMAKLSVILFRNPVVSVQGDRPGNAHPHDPAFARQSSPFVSFGRRHRRARKFLATIRHRQRPASRHCWTDWRCDRSGSDPGPV